MTDRGLHYALGASILVHGLVLGLGGGLPVPQPEAPHLLEARLIPKAPPEVLQERKTEVPHLAPPVPHAAPPQPARHPRAATRPEPVALQQRLVSEAPSDHPAPAIVTAPAPSTPLAASAPAAAGPVAPAAGPPSQTAAAASYSPPNFGARYLDNPKPGYPLIARRRGLEGTVKLDVRVSAEGIPIAVKVRDSGGHESLDEAAVTAVWHWRFVPARRGGDAVEASVIVPIRFRLSSEDAG
ncbi:MAG TPA: TonB family protein [Zoogloea sp.]|nr:TonB family protein [Zoogloea sp.]